MKNMKSIISLLLLVAMCLSLFAGCKKDKEKDELLILDETVQETTEAPTEPETEPATIPTVPETEPVIVETEPEIIETEPVETEPAVDNKYDNIAGDTARYTEVDQTVYAINDVNIRTGPGVNYNKIGLLKFGSAVNRIAYSNHGWSKVIYNDQIVYISSEYLSTKKPTSAIDPYDPTEKEDKDDEDTKVEEVEKEDTQTGSNGNTGSSGNTGNSGSTGNTGSAGNTGNTGNTGSGTTGSGNSGSGTTGGNTGSGNEDDDDDNTTTGGNAGGNGSEGSGNTGAGSGTSHDHSYSTTVFDPTCKENGYTVYRCSCGYSFTSNQTPATGVCVYNSWALTVPPTYDREGTETRTCCMCGGQETRSVPKLEREEEEDEGESISTSSLAAHGNSYASTLGFIVDTSMNSGNSAYFPALDYNIKTMSEGYSAVESAVRTTFDRLEATGESPVGVCRANVAVSYGYEHPTRGAMYYVTVYYG